MPPITASRHDSVSSWRTSCQRPAPIESRIAISPLRAADRASSRFAMFAHAMRSTSPVTPRRICSGTFASFGTLLWPWPPGVMVSAFARNRAIV